MDKWDEFVLLKYEDYMAQNCTCHRADEECVCITLQDFEYRLLRKIEEQRAEEAYYDLEVACHQ